MQQTCNLTPINTHIVVDEIIQPFVQSVSIYFCLTPLRKKYSKYSEYSLTATTLEQEYGSVVKHIKQHHIRNFSIRTFFRQGIKRPTFVIECLPHAYPTEALYIQKIRLIGKDNQVIDEVFYGELEITLDYYMFHIYDYHHNPILKRCRTRSFKVNSVGLATFHEPFTLFVEN
jgi:hypothetical protein